MSPHPCGDRLYRGVRSAISAAHAYRSGRGQARGQPVDEAIRPCRAEQTVERDAVLGQDRCGGLGPAHKAAERASTVAFRSRHADADQTVQPPPAQFQQPVGPHHHRWAGGAGPGSILRPAVTLSGMPTSIQCRIVSGQSGWQLWPTLIRPAVSHLREVPPSV